MNPHFAIALLLLQCLTSFQTLAAEEHRGRALLIGNTDYNPAFFSTLTTACADVRELEKTLKSLGVDAVAHCQKSAKNINDLLRDFGDASDDAAFRLIYIAGHGAQFGNDIYLFGHDAAPDAKEIVRLVQRKGANPQSAGNRVIKTRDAIPLSELFGEEPSPLIVVLDACRDSPILSQIGAIPIGGQANAALNVLVAFSTSAGRTSFDALPGSALSPYASALIEALREPQRSVPDLFVEARRNVVEKTSRFGPPQVPMELNGLQKHFCIGACDASNGVKEEAPVEATSNERLLLSQARLVQLGDRASDVLAPGVAPSSDVEQYPHSVTVYRARDRTTGPDKDYVGFMRFDLFWCGLEHQRRAAIEAANQLQRLASSDLRVAGTTVGDVRIRRWTEEQNARAGFRVDSNVIRYEEAEALEIGWLKVLQAETLFRRLRPSPVVNRTKNYMSFFFCGGSPD